LSSLILLLVQFIMECCFFGLFATLGFIGDTLAESIATVNSLARPPDDQFHNELMEQYGRVRRFLPKLFTSVQFKAAPAGMATIDALNYLANLATSRNQILDNPPLGIIINSWKRVVFDAENQVTKRGYTLCFLGKLQDSLRRRDVYVENSDRWSDPRAKLLKGADWKANRIQVCRSLDHPVSPDAAITRLTQQLDAAYRQVAARFDKNVCIYSLPNDPTSDQF